MMFKYDYFERQINISFTLAGLFNVDDLMVMFNYCSNMFHDCKNT